MCKLTVCCTKACDTVEIVTKGRKKIRYDLFWAVGTFECRFFHGPLWKIPEECAFNQGAQRIDQTKPFLMEIDQADI